MGGKGLSYEEDAGILVIVVVASSTAVYTSSSDDGTSITEYARLGRTVKPRTTFALVPYNPSVVQNSGSSRGGIVAVKKTS